VRAFWSRLAATTWARSLEFVRDRSALGWNIAFPVLLVIGMAYVFSGPGRPLFKVAVLAPPGAALDARLSPFLATPGVQFYRAHDLAGAQRKVALEQVDMAIDLRGEPARDWINPQSQKGRLLQRVLAGTPGVHAVDQMVRGDTVRYVDWLAPGVFGMNLMFSCLFGIGYVIVRYRKNGYLKRLNATPISAFEFVLAQLLSRLLLVMVVTVFVYAATDALVHFRMLGSYALLFGVTVLGAFAMIALGLVISARVASEELAGGLLNLASWPMMVLSGVFFSLDGAPEPLRLAAQALPLTQLLEAARAIMLEGAGVAQIAPHLLALAGMSVLFLLLGAFGFRWSQD
jgi:ABC-type multidrug transport system, permease component